MNQLATQQERLPMNSVGVSNTSTGAKIAPQNLGEVVKFAEVMCRADIALPQHLRGNAGACMAVALQALEWSMSPFAVASKSYAVGGRIAYEAQLIAAVVNTRSGIKGRLKYRYDGEGSALTCTVTGTLDGEECVYTSPPIGSITVKNSPLWKSDPQQQLGYFAARSWARRHCPEVILGVYDRDEAEDFRGPDKAKDITPNIDPFSDEPISGPHSLKDEQEPSTTVYHDGEAFDASTGEQIDQSQDTGSHSSSEPETAGDPPNSSSATEADEMPSSSASNPSEDVPDGEISLSDRKMLIECCKKLMFIVVDQDLSSAETRRGVLETSKDAWKMKLKPELHDQLKAFFQSADRQIKAPTESLLKLRANALDHFADVLETTVEELEG